MRMVAAAIAAVRIDRVAGWERSPVSENYSFVMQFSESDWDPRGVKNIQSTADPTEAPRSQPNKNIQSNASGPKIGKEHIIQCILPENPEKTYYPTRPA